MENNEMKIEFLSLSQNETFARSVISCFCLQLNPSIAELSDIKTAVSEAVTNCVVHGYPDTPGIVTMEAVVRDHSIHIKISDNGVGIENLEKAVQPFYTTKPDEERSGMGFTIIQSFMEDVKIVSELNKGTVIFMKKTISPCAD